MPSTFARVFTSINRNGYTPVNSHLPLLNEFSSSLSGYVSSQNQLSKKKALMRWYKSIPELTAFVNKISRDIVSRYHFETVNPSDSGRNRLLKANRFAAEVQLRKVMESQVADALITGEAFGWIGKLSETQIEDVAEKMSRLYTGFERYTIQPAYSLQWQPVWPALIRLKIAVRYHRECISLHSR